MLPLWVRPAIFLLLIKLGNIPYWESNRKTSLGGYKNDPSLLRFYLSLEDEYWILVFIQSAQGCSLKAVWWPVLSVEPKIIERKWNPWHSSQSADAPQNSDFVKNYVTGMRTLLQHFQILVRTQESVIRKKTLFTRRFHYLFSASVLCYSIYIMCKEYHFKIHLPSLRPSVIPTFLQSGWWTSTNSEIPHVQWVT